MKPDQVQITRNNEYVRQRMMVLDAVRTEIARAIGPANQYLPGVAMDAQTGIGFLISQLAYTEAQVFSRMRPPMQYAQLIPISTEAGDWADSIRYETQDHVGRGKRISASAQDIPMANVLIGEGGMPVQLGGIGYEYSTEELRRTAYLRRPLPTAKLNAAIDGYERHMNDVGLNGEIELPGLVNNPQITAGTAPNGSWSADAPDEILADVNYGIQKVWTNTAYTDVVTTIALPPDEYALLFTTRLPNTDLTLLDWVKAHNIAMTERGQQIELVAVAGLQGAGTGGTNRALFYVKRPDRLVMHIPMSLRFLAPQAIALMTKIPGEYKYSGIEWYYPQSGYYMDGI